MLKRLRVGALLCLFLSCTGFGILILKGCFSEAALYPLAVLGLLGCAGMTATGLYALSLWVKKWISARQGR